MHKQKKEKKKKKWKSKLQAGCLALGLATAWGAEARGEAILQVSATPAQTLTNAFVYYYANGSCNGLESLGTLPTGQTSVLSRTLPFDPDNYSNCGYVLIGLHDDGTSAGVTVSFPNDDILVLHSQWEEVFGFAEVDAIDALYQAGSGDVITLYYLLYYNTNFVQTPRGNEGTLVSFSNPTFGGVVTVDILPVPEPAAWVLLISLAGTVLLWRRDLIGR